MVVGDGQKLEGTSDVKQWPLELTVCEVSDEQNAAHIDTRPKDHWSETKTDSPFVLNRPSWGALCGGIVAQ